MVLLDTLPAQERLNILYYCIIICTFGNFELSVITQIIEKNSSGQDIRHGGCLAAIVRMLLFMSTNSFESCLESSVLQFWGWPSKWGY